MMLKDYLDQIIRRVLLNESYDLELRAYISWLC